MDSSIAAVKLTEEGSDCLLELAGSFQLELAQALHAAAQDAAGGSRNVLIDCSAAEHLDGCAVQVLLALKKAVEESGRKFRLQGVNTQVGRYLAWAGLADCAGGAEEGSAAEVRAEQSADKSVENDIAEVASAPRKRRARARKRPA